jgi:hypothetical protein
MPIHDSSTVMSGPAPNPTILHNGPTHDSAQRTPTPTTTRPTYPHPDPHPPYVPPPRPPPAQRTPTPIVILHDVQNPRICPSPAPPLPNPCSYKLAGVPHS